MKGLRGRVKGLPARPRPALKLEAAAARVSPPVLSRSATLRVEASSGVYEGAERHSNAHDGFNPAIRVPTAMAAPLGSSGGGALMEKSKLAFQQQQQSRTPKLDDAGGGGGIGNKIHNGGGGGDDDDDDDDYFNEDGDGDEGDDSVWWHKEWCMTVEALPGFLRMLAGMQYYSTAQWVRYLTMQERPNLFRTVERTLSRFPDARSGFVGRMLADPAFMQKTAMEGGLAFAVAMAHELHVRGARIKDELDYALISAVCLAAGAAACSALVAPSKQPTPPPSRFPWQSMLSKLPNNAFEKNTPARSFEVPQRISGFLAKGVELSAVSAITGGVSTALQHCAVAARQTKNPKYKPVTPIPGISRAAGGMGIYGGAATNARLQVAAGIEQTLLEYAKANTTWQVMGLSALYRGLTLFALENPWAMGPPQLVACSRPGLAGMPTGHVPTPVKPKTTRKVKKLVKRKKAPSDPADTSAGFSMSTTPSSPSTATGAPAYAGAGSGAL